MSSSPDRILFGVTVGTTANLLLRGQLSWLGTQGWQVHLACAPGPDLDAVAEREGAIPHPLPMAREIRPLQDLRALWGWFALIRRLRPDAIHLSTPKAALLGAIAAWSLRVPRRVYLVRGLRLEGANGPARLLLWLAERLTIGLSTDVVVVSPSLGSELVANCLLGRKRVVLIGKGSSNGVDAAGAVTQVEAKARGPQRERLGLGSDDFVVGYVGRIVVDKGIDTLLAAVERSASRPTLLLVGGIDDSRLAMAIAAATVPVVHVDWTVDVWSHYAAMDLLCLPTRREGFPNVVLEAAAAGIPCISTDATGAIDAVVPGVTGETVPVGDVDALAAAIDALAADAATRNRMGAAVRARATKDFRPEDIWAGMDAILRCQHSHNVNEISD